MPALDFGSDHDIAEGDRIAKGPVLVLRHEGVLRAVGSRCPHMGYPMAKGTLREGVLTCAWHAWDFDLDHGGCYRGACDDLPVYPVQIIDGRVVVSVADAGVDTAREERRLTEALMEGDLWLQSKALARLLDGPGRIAHLVEVVLAHGFRHAVAAHRSRQAAVEARAVLDAAALAQRLPEGRQLAALVQGVRTVGGPVGDRPAVHAVPAGLDAAQLQRRLARFVDEPSDLGIERLLLTCVHSDLPALALDLATRVCLFDRMETVHGVVAALDATRDPTSLPRRAALLAWVLGEERGDDDGETRAAKRWVQQQSGMLTAASTVVDVTVAGLAALLESATDPVTFLRGIADMQDGSSSTQMLVVFTEFFARRAAHQVPGSGGLVGSALTGLRWARAVRRAHACAEGPHRERLTMMLAWHAFRTRWLQVGAEPTHAASADYAAAFAANDAATARAAAITALTRDAAALGEWLALVLDDDLGAGLLEVVAEAVDLREAGHPAWPAAVGAAMNGIIDQRLRGDVRAAARFGRSMRPQ